MTRRTAQTKKVCRFLNQALSGFDYCAAHKGNVSPGSAPNAARVYAWTWENLKTLLR